MARKRIPTRGILRLPLLLLIWGGFSLAMWLPAVHALIVDDHQTSRSFFYAGLAGGIGVVFIGFSVVNRQPKHGMPGQLMTLLATFVFLPLFLAIPVQDALQNTTYINAYFDMVSALTTTGANLYSAPERLPESIHLWRALVAWLGGLFMWIAASAVMAPLSLGGFEVTARAEPGEGLGNGSQEARRDDASHRKLIVVCRALFPVYIGLTFALMLLLVLSGERTLTATVHAMSVMATSGISSIGGLANGQGGFAAEFVIFLFMLFALSRLTFSSDTIGVGTNRLDLDPEFRTGILIIIAVPILLFLRHWLATFEVDSADNFGLAISSLWGAIFTVTAFLTTTGFESAHWAAAQQWSGLQTPGMILMGLALMGGGVATTAGGVKLLRVYALYLNGLREMELLTMPNSVSSLTRRNRRLQSNGAYVAWVFFMLFALSLAVISIALSATGISFEDALILTVATLSTTGPLTDIAGNTPIDLGLLETTAKLILCFAMVLGRLETLAIIALLSPNLWRS